MWQFLECVCVCVCVCVRVCVCVWGGAFIALFGENVVGIWVKPLNSNELTNDKQSILIN